MYLLPQSTDHLNERIPSTLLHVHPQRMQRPACHNSPKFVRMGNECGAPMQNENKENVIFVNSTKLACIKKQKWISQACVDQTTNMCDQTLSIPSPHTILIIPIRTYRARINQFACSRQEQHHRLHHVSASDDAHSKIKIKSIKLNKCKYMSLNVRPQCVTTSTKYNMQCVLYVKAKGTKM